MSYELPSVYACDTRTARRKHKCCECGLAINPGDTYAYHHGVWEGRGESYKCCIFCEALRKQISMEMAGEWNDDEGIAFGELKEAAMVYGFRKEWAELISDRREDNEKARI